MLAWMFQPSSSDSSAPIAYMLMPGREHRHHREGQRVEGARLLVEPQLEVLGNAAGARAVVERHHEDADEEHRRNRAHPVEVAGHDPVLGAAGRHADHLLRAEVGGEEREAGDPGRDRPAGEQEVAAARDPAADGEADPEDEHAVQGDQQQVNRGDMHSAHSLCGKRLRSVADRASARPSAAVERSSAGCAHRRGRRWSRP